MRAQNTQLAAGELGQVPAAPGQQLNAVIVTRSRLSTPEEFGEVIVRSSSSGATVKVKDIARVELGAQDYSIQARIDGQPTAAIAVRMAPGANALDTAKAIKTRMAELARYFPKGMDWVVPYDTSRFVEISIREVLITLAEAMILVFFVMYLFLGNLRATFIPAIVVPVALVGATVGSLHRGLFDQRADAVCDGAGHRHRGRRRHRRGRECRAHHERRRLVATRCHAQGDGSDHRRDHCHHRGAFRRIRPDGLFRRLDWSHLSSVCGDAGADHDVFRADGGDPDAGPVRHPAQA